MTWLDSIRALICLHQTKGFGIAQGDASGNGGFIGTTSFWLNYEDFYTAYAPSGYWLVH